MVARAGQLTILIPYKYTVVTPAKPVGLAHARIAALAIQLYVGIIHITSNNVIVYYYFIFLIFSHKVDMARV